MDEMKVFIKGKAGGKKFTYETEQQSEFSEFNFTVERAKDVIKLVLHPKKEIVMDTIRLSFHMPCAKNDSILMNGYQSWTDTHEKLPSERETHLYKIMGKAIDKYKLRGYGDYDFTRAPEKAGQFHGFTYCYIRREHRYRLLASLSEREGYTVFYYDAGRQEMVIEKDCKGYHVTKDWNVFDLVCLVGTENEVFDEYFQRMGVEKPVAKPVRGYTSWYNHYQNISEDILNKSMQAAVDHKAKWDVFQIDDGYQMYVGDWLDVNEEKFPNGLGAMSKKIHEEGMLAGLWLAPFVCETKSRLFREHPDWILRGQKGEMICAGSNWSVFYPLDLQKQEVKEYLRHVFDVVLNTWNFDLVKLDFLYAACMKPLPNKTRGQLMCEAMDFLREVVGKKLILGCGVPLGPSFGKIDYCRVGCDVGLYWDDKIQYRFLHRERVSTKNTLGNTIYRRQLDGRGFLNDPDVYLLRDSNMHMSAKQKETLAKINAMLGSILFTSDQVGEYDENKWKLYWELEKLEKVKPEITKSGKITTVSYNVEDKNHFIELRL